MKDRREKVSTGSPAFHKAVPLGACDTQEMQPSLDSLSSSDGSIITLTSVAPLGIGPNGLHARCRTTN